MLSFQLILCFNLRDKIYVRTKKCTAYNPSLFLPSKFSYVAVGYSIIIVLLFQTPTIYSVSALMEWLVEFGVASRHALGEFFCTMYVFCSAKCWPNWNGQTCFYFVKNRQNFLCEYFWYIVYNIEIFSGLKCSNMFVFGQHNLIEIRQILLNLIGHLGKFYLYGVENIGQIRFFRYI